MLMLRYSLRCVAANARTGCPHSSELPATAVRARASRSLRATGMRGPLPNVMCVLGASPMGA